MDAETDIVLVGAGPSGLEMAVALRREGFEFIHLEGGQVGATMAWWPMGTRWFSSNDRISIAGVPLITPQQEKATREEYLAYLRGIVLQFDLQIRLYETVLSVVKNADRFIVTSQRRGVTNRIKARRVILSTGGTAAPRVLNIPGEQLPHVTHYLNDPHTYFRQRLVIVGGRNSAVESAVRCCRAGATVTVVDRAAAIDDKHIKYWLWPEFDSLVKAGQIQLLNRAELTAITDSHVSVRTPQGSREIPADFVLLHIGYIADMSLFEKAGVELVPPQKAPQFDAETMQTNVPGLYVCGTATGGTQERYRIFLENCHVHVPRIIAALRGGHSSAKEKVFNRPES